MPLAFFLAVTWTAADFGYHWDEPWGHVRPLKTALERGTVVTGCYIYPGLNFWLNLSALAPDYLASRNLVEAVQGRPYLLRARRVRMALTGLAIVWVYLLMLALGRPVPEALLAAAGLACGMKYPGGLALLPVVLVEVTRPPRVRERLKYLAWPGLVFAATFLMTTPAALLDFRQFKDQLVRLKEIYGDEGWFGYTVESPHLGKLLSYLGSSALSPLPALAWALFGCAVWGAFRLLRTERRPASILLAFPAAYAAYFSLQNVMIARNYLALVPFVAISAAVGIGDVWRRLPMAGLRGLWALAAAAAVTYNAAWQIDASRSILRRADHRAVLGQLDDHIRGDAEARYFLSERLQEALAFRGGEPSPNVVEDAGRGSVVAASLRELGADFPAHRGLLQGFGPREVDLDRYPTWAGQDRPVTMPMAGAVRVPLALSQIVRRRIVFPNPPAGAREALFLAGDEREGDQLYVESTAEGAVIFGLESWGKERDSPFAPGAPGPRGFTDPALRVEPSRPYSLVIDWGVARGELRVVLDGRLVFSHYGPLHAARLGELHVGRTAALPGHGAAAFSGALEPAPEAGPWRPLASSAGDPVRLVPADARGRALAASLWEPAAELKATRKSDSLVVVTTPRRFEAAAYYGPLVLPQDGEYLFNLRFEVAGYSPLGPLWYEGGLALGVLSADRGRWLAFRRTAGPISEWRPELTIRVFARADEPVWLVALNDPPWGRGASTVTLRDLGCLVRPAWRPRPFG